MIEIDARKLAAAMAVLTLTGCGGAVDRETGDDGFPEGRTPVEEVDSARAGAGETAPEAASAEDDGALGPALEKPERYYGVYASAERPGRKWFVAEARRPPYAERAPEVPPGHLAVGAMFGDVAPWHMRTLSATDFEQARVPDHQPAPVKVRFEFDGDGRAVAMTFVSEGLADEGRLLRQGELPEKWQ